ncbi:hypothetical protein D8674_033118 [Pyrus ussuriensis x Pyrus communis]|uniref:EIPR1-like beta-propeller domain-containing protein n=1 Tax=Pyrus ussuriensis x Pyrus communis TaxID=2448454 RepID=A0A5N5HNV5_9ROSA|nr:hypothetical protein D8674_033118 [Pyrus ussuriensis x Pyrus communis]
MDRMGAKGILVGEKKEEEEEKEESERKSMRDRGGMSESYGAAIWQIPELYGELNSPQLERITSLDSQVGKIKWRYFAINFLWNITRVCFVLFVLRCGLWPSGRHDKLISIDEENLSLWSLDLSKKAAQVMGSMPRFRSGCVSLVSEHRFGSPAFLVQSQESAGVMHYLSAGAWDPHDINAVAATCESSIQFWDLRTMKKTNSIEHAHVRNVDYNPKKKHVLITAEDESGIHVWDLRKPNVPIQELPGHTQRTWAARYNPEYDGLMLVCLEWSSREPWIFASLSYDGRKKTFRPLPLFSSLPSLSSTPISLASCFSVFYFFSLGFSTDRHGWKLRLVHKLMPIRSRQEALLDWKCRELIVWKKRFALAMCCWTRIPNAKIGDFGLARLKTEVDGQGEHGGVLVEEGQEEEEDEKESGKGKAGWG